MANYRIPGPLCSSRQPWSLDDGTLALTQTPSPGSICATSWNYPTQEMQNLPAARHQSDLGFLFLSCPAPERGLSDKAYCDAAATLGVEVAAIQAVAEVETSGNAFDNDGRPRILFERHYFHRLTAGKYDSKHETISNAKSGGYGKFSVQYTKLEQAFKLDADAALRAASWGRFQIMGNNFKAAGFDSVSKFVLAHFRSESEHLKAFTNFVLSKKSLQAALRKKNWAEFAAAYNGPSYKKNNYDIKMADAYKRLSQPASPRTGGKP